MKSFCGKTCHCLFWLIVSETEVDFHMMSVKIVFHGTFCVIRLSSGASIKTRRVIWSLQHQRSVVSDSIATTIKSNFTAAKKHIVFSFDLYRDESKRCLRPIKNQQTLLKQDADWWWQHPVSYPLSLYCRDYYIPARTSRSKTSTDIHFQKHTV